MAKTPLSPTIGGPATNALHANGIYFLEDLTDISEKELASLHGVGPKAIRILKQALSDANLKLAET